MIALNVLSNILLIHTERTAVSESSVPIVTPQPVFTVLNGNSSIYKGVGRHGDTMSKQPLPGYTGFGDRLKDDECPYNRL